ncbi:MAG: hypothetical protein E7214_08210 [Clostridium sp.]|nr:hypothetical protein [Clostridium sp.]
MGWNVISVDYKEENPPAEARLQDSSVNIQLDGGELRTKLRINTDVALDLADKIRTALGEKDFDTLEDELLSKDAKIEELENLIEQYEENNDAYREKMTLSSGPF